MRITFIYPIYLLLLGILPLTIVIGWLAWRSRWTVRRGLSLLLRLMIMVLLIFSLAGIQVRYRSNMLTTVFVLDVSDSIPPAEIARGEAIIRAALQSKPPEDQAAIVVFGEDALVERLASKESTLGQLTSNPVTSRTNLEAALQLAQALLPAEGAKRIVLLSDGRENIGTALDQAELAALNQIELLFVSLGDTQNQAEVLIDAFEAPTETRLGEHFDLSVIVQSTTRTRATLRIFEDGALLSSREVDLQPGLNRFRIPVQTQTSSATAQGGFRRFRAQIVPDVDSRLQNNQADAFTIVHGPPAILLVESQASEGENIARALSAAGMNVTRIAPQQLPTTLPELARYDSIVLANVNATTIPSATMQALPLYVREAGRGLVMIGGDQSFGAGGYLRTPLENALPLDMDVRDRELQANLALILAVDKSGSMGRCHCDNPDLNQSYTRREVGQPKVDIAKEAIMRAASALGRQDYLGVVAFDDRPRWVLRPTQLPQPAELEAAISAFQAEGQTNLQAGVAAAYQALQEVPARRKHIILMTDGWVRQGDLTALAQEMKNQGITLSVVAAGEGSAEYLASLAQLGGGAFYPATDIFRVPEFFLKETVRSAGEYIIEETFYPLPAAPSQVLRGLEVSSLPPLLGYNGTTPKNTARLDLLTPRGDPLLATWQYGLGRSAAWTSDLKGQWGRYWIAWEGFQQFVTQLVRWTLPAPKAEGLEVQAHLDEGRAIIQVNALGEDGLPLNDLQGSVVLINPALEPLEAPLRQVGPGQYEANASVSQPGVYLARVGVNRGDQSLGQITLGIAVPYSPEYKTSGADLHLLYQLATITGGGELGQPEVAFKHDLPSTESARSIWWPLLLVAILMFPFEVALRRLRLTSRDWVALQLWVQKHFARPTLSPQSQPPLLAPLFQARQRARQRLDKEIQPKTPGDESTAISSGGSKVSPPVPPQRKAAHSITTERRPAPLPEESQPSQPSSEEKPSSPIGEETPEDLLTRLQRAKKRARR